MAETSISWADYTFNPWIGCTKISIGEHGACVGCYAEAMATRHGWAKWGDEPRYRTSEGNWRQPLAWNRKAERDGTRPFVFCASLADVFDNQVDPAWRRDLFDLIRATPHLVWLLLTKRPQNIAKLFVGTITPELRVQHQGPEHLGRSLWPSNAAMGCTVVTQAEADRDIPVLLAAKAGLKPAFAFVSMEPLMGPVDLTNIQAPRFVPEDHDLDWKFSALESGDYYQFQDGMGFWEGGDGPEREALDWVITGGETDQGAHKARPSHPDWFRSLRDQCAAAGVPYHFKQWGEWIGYTSDVRPDTNPREVRRDVGATPVFRLGKKAAGRALDGVIHDARPNP